MCGNRSLRHSLDLPKVELHLHLEGSLSDAFWAQMSPGTLAAIRFFRDDPGKSLGPFLKCMEQIHRALRTPEDYGKACRDLIDGLERDNVRYAEVTWAPGGIWEFHGVPPRDVYSEIGAAIEDRRGRVDVRILVDLIRNQPLQTASDIMDWVERDRPSLVAGINVGGDEVRFSLARLLPSAIPSYLSFQSNGLA